MVNSVAFTATCRYSRRRCVLATIRLLYPLEHCLYRKGWGATLSSTLAMCGEGLSRSRSCTPCLENHLCLNRTQSSKRAQFFPSDPPPPPAPSLIWLTIHSIPSWRPSPVLADAAWMNHVRSLMVWRFSPWEIFSSRVQNASGKEVGVACG